MRFQKSTHQQTVRYMGIEFRVIKADTSRVLACMKGVWPKPKDHAEEDVWDFWA